jgi:hypothetical protein
MGDLMNGAQCSCFSGALLIRTIHPSLLLKLTDFSVKLLQLTSLSFSLPFTYPTLLSNGTLVCHMQCFISYAASSF